ncbi:MAG: hypothetical protein LBD93_11790 [Treponema sp.]|nr:hypothetical protein [Treponema sp.]
MQKVLFPAIGLGLVSFYACIHTQAQQSSDTALLLMTDAGPYSLVERSDWRRYDNGKYIGHVYHEVRASIILQSGSSPADA